MPAIVQKFMAKCPVCSERKAKRACRVVSGYICSLCCGTTRSSDKCGDCIFFKPPMRDYDHMPRFHPGEMDASDYLQAISFPIEAAVCSLDREQNFTMKDDEAYIPHF